MYILRNLLKLLVFANVIYSQSGDILILNREGNLLPFELNVSYTHIHITTEKKNYIYRY